MNNSTNKIKKIIIIGIGCYLAYNLYFFYEIARYGYSMNWETCKQYLWIFKDYVIGDLKEFERDSFVCLSYTKKRDVCNIFHYYHDNWHYPITVWEFKDLANVDLNKISINQNVILDNIKFISGGIMNPDSSMPITVNYGFSFRSGIGINLDRLSRIDGTFEGPNYGGFYGKIHKMSFSDGKGKHQILFEYIDDMYNHLTKQYNIPFSYTVFLLYKGRESFYVIIISSRKPFEDASIINILNLE